MISPLPPPEEARCIAEREERERVERERLEQKDRERREDELNELRHLLEVNQSAVKAWEAACRESAKWDRYRLCDGSPNPAVQPEINAFISLWKEDPVGQIQPLLQQCAMALRLTDELDLLVREEPEPSVAQMYQETRLTLQNLIHDKLLQATEEILKSAKEQSDIETGNMQAVVRDDNVTLCLWANLNKNPRFKGHQFKEVGMGFELPKQLVTSDIGVRMLHTRYDHLSDLSRHARVHGRRPAAIEVGTVTLLAQTPEVAEDGGMRVEGKERGNPQHAEDEPQSLRTQGKKVSLHASVQGQGREAQTETVTDRPTFPGEGAESVSDTTNVHVVDLHQYTPLGGVFYFDVFYLPPQSVTVNGWEMRKLLDTGLLVFPYPSEQSQVHSSVAGRVEESGTHSSPPVGVTVRLPESVVFLEEPQVARWDPADQQWRSDGVSETCYQAEERSLSFKMASFSAFTLLQDSHANMPFQSWELRPLGQDSAQLTITAALVEVSITVKGNRCMLQMERARELTPILGRWMNLPALQAAMRRSGINMFVNEYSEKYVDVHAKDPLIEHTAYEQMALVSSAFAFSWSRWNAQCQQQHLVLQVCEQLEAGPVPAKAWSLYLLGAQRSHRLKMTEWSAAFSPELAEGSEFHSTFLHMLRDGVSAEGWARVNHAHPLYINTVQALLCSTRVLTFS
uniref:Dynein axonemal intermediate chain 7 n=1 Tax=Electrophorus electricus TaxID=8005 RepID=A0A4W4FXN1_ELEEL